MKFIPRKESIAQKYQQEGKLRFTFLQLFSYSNVRQKAKIGGA